MAKWKIDKIPEHTLSTKYLRMVLTTKQYEDLIRKYMKAKETTLMTRMKKLKTKNVKNAEVKE